MRAMPSFARFAIDKAVTSLPFKKNPSRVRRLAAGELVDEGGLAGAVRADDRVQLAGHEVEADVVGHLERAIGLSRWRVSRMGDVIARPAR